ncbi:hypothetical protein DB347_22775 [Opitutaceae bacterium EW11]|nr:hypothetical protein DB347_22775 [Opitutaceae bacterium EW11]
MSKGIDPRGSLGSMLRALALVLVVLSALSEASAVNVTITASYAGGQGEAMMRLGTISLAGSGDQSGRMLYDIQPDSTALLYFQTYHTGTYSVQISAPSGYVVTIDGVRRQAYTETPTEELASRTLKVSLARRETIASSTAPLGEASSVSWYPVSNTRPDLGSPEAPYLSFNLGNAENGDGLPPLRIPLLQRTSASEPLVVPDIAGSSYIPADGAFELRVTEVTVRLDLDTDASNPGGFYVRFYPRGGQEAFASYRFTFPEWKSNADMTTSKRARVIKSLSGSENPYEITVAGRFSHTGLGIGFPVTIEDWHVIEKPAVRRVTVCRTKETVDMGLLSDRFQHSAVYTDTVEVRSGTAPYALVAARKTNYNGFVKGVNGGLSFEYAYLPGGTVEGAGDDNLLTSVLDDPNFPETHGSVTPEGKIHIETDAVSSSNYTKVLYENWLDAEAPFYRPSLFPSPVMGANSGIATTVSQERDARWADFHWPKQTTQQIGDLVISRTVVNYDEETVDAGDPSRSDDDLKVVVAARRNYYKTDDDSAYIETVAKNYRPDILDLSLRNRPYSIKSPAGAKQSYAYEHGTYGSGGTFTVDSAGTDLRVTTLSGVAGGGNTVTGLGSLRVDSLGMVPYRSTKAVEILHLGRLVRRELWVFTGGSGSAPVFEGAGTGPVSWEAFEYTVDGRLRKHLASNGSLSEATWLGSRKTEETDETGLVTSMLYDDADRITRITREAAGGIPAQVTSMTYDAADRVLTSSIGQEGSAMTSTTAYYGSGRVRQQTDSAGVVTTHTYSADNRTITETRQDGSTKVTKLYLDGRTKSVTGTSVVTPEYYSYDFDSQSRVRKTVHLGIETGRKRQVTTDPLGRTIEERADGFTQPDGSSHPVVTTSTYNSRGLLEQKRVVEEGGVGSLSADEAYEYDEFGSVKSSGLNLDGVAGLQAGSVDRFSTTETSFYKDPAGVWWAMSSSKVYYKENSQDSYTSSTYTEISGLPDGVVARVNSYDIRGNLTASVTSIDRNAKARIISVVAANGGTQVTVAVGGLVKTQESYPRGGSAGSQQTTTYTYDGCGRVSTITDPRGVVTAHEYYPGTPRVYRTYVGHDRNNQAILLASYTYDSMGRVDTVTDAKGATSTTTYYLNGLVQNQTGTGCYPVHHVYDGYGQRTELWTYRNGPTGTADKTVFTYDEATGLLKSRRDATGQEISFSYSYADGFKIITQTSARGVKTTNKYSLATGELSSTAYSDGTPAVSFSYTRTGKVESVTDATGTRDIVYDYEQVASEALDAQWYGGLAVTTRFDAVAPESGGVPGRYAGFGLGYITGVPADLSKEMAVDIGYDAFGRVDSVAATYPAQGARGGSSAAFSYSYTPGSSFWDRMSSGGHTVQRRLEPRRDALQSCATYAGSTVVAAYAYTTNTSGERESVLQSGSAFADYGSPTFFKYAYAHTGELTNAQGYAGAAVGDTARPLPGRGYSFSYDTAGNRKSVGVDAESVSYTDGQGNTGGNALNQVKQRGTLRGRSSGTASAEATVTVDGAAVARQGRYWDIALDRFGQYKQLMISAARGVETSKRSANILLRPASETLAYDADGNLTDDSVWHYGWDAENRLISMSTRDAAIAWGTPSRRMEFRYDYLGRRVEKTVWEGQAVVYSRRYVYQGWSLIAEFEFAGSLPKVCRSYVWGLDVDSSLSRTGGVGALIYEAVHSDSSLLGLNVASDGNGNVIALIKPGEAQASVSYEYDPFGQLLRAEGGDENALGNPFRHSTKYQDLESGLYYYGRRYYDANLGRFISRDPIQESGGVNLYGFVGNHPVYGADYLGMLDIDTVVMDRFFVRPDDDSSSGSFSAGWSGGGNAGNGVALGLSLRSTVSFAERGQYLVPPGGMRFRRSVMEDFWRSVAKARQERNVVALERLARAHGKALSLASSGSPRAAAVALSEAISDADSSGAGYGEITAASGAGFWGGVWDEVQYWRSTVSNAMSYSIATGRQSRRVRAAPDWRLDWAHLSAYQKGARSASYVPDALLVFGPAIVAKFTSLFAAETTSLASQRQALLNVLSQRGAAIEGRYALGLDAAGLDAFAESLNAKTLNGVFAQEWKAAFPEVMSNPNNKIFFNLNNVEVWPGVQRAAAGVGGATDFELFQISQNPQWWPRIQFMENGGAAANPFK